MTADTRDWAEKYRPTSLSDIVGNEAAVKALRHWAETFGTGKKAVILYGSPGVGKTSAALALAHDLGWDYIELNASDVRTKDAINRIAGPAATAGTFEGIGGRRLVILDEADNLHGNYDRGGEAAIINVIKHASQPVILIANDMYAMSKPLRESALQIQFRAILSTSVAKVLRKVCTQENLKCDPEALMKIAERTSDLRSAINDLQAAAQGSGQVALADVSTGDRDVPETVFKVMGMIFRGKNMREALNATYGLDENPEDLIGWVDENLPREYQDCDLERGFEALSKADIYLGRVRRRQDYGMWRYAGFMEVCGINQARKSHYGGFSRYSPPTYWQKLGRAKSARTIRDSIAAKIGKACHSSKAEARSSYLPLIRFIFDRDEYAVKLSAQLKLEEDEIAYLLDSKKTSKKVGEIYRKSRDLIEEEIEEEIDAFAHFSKRPERGAQAEEAKPPAAEELPAKPKRTRRKSRDGGEPVDEPAAAEPELEGPTPAAQAPAESALPQEQAPAVPESKPPEAPAVQAPAQAPEGEKPAPEEKLSKKQRTLFDF